MLYDFWSIHLRSIVINVLLKIIYLYFDAKLKYALKNINMYILFSQ